MRAADVRHGEASLQQKLHALYNLSPRAKVSRGFRPEYLNLLRAFGDPQKKLPPTIHIAGTNGKGSTLAFARAILEANGYAVHAYTSPHLIEFNERIYLAGKNIGNSDLEALIDRALELNAGVETTFFEITTAMAFAAFAETPADVFLCETGLGGRLDCTNVIENPAATIVTTISYDHMEFLGPTLAQIAAEKAGIMKPSAPCVVGAQEHSEALEFLLQEAAQKGIETVSYEVAPAPSGLGLRGDHQVRNAQAALAALQTMKDRFPLDPVKTQHGLKNASWPARLQYIDIKEKYPNIELWYDGGHNESAAKILADQAQRWREKDGLPLHLIVGMKKDKDAGAFVAPLAPFAETITLIDVPGVASVQDLPGVSYRRAASISAALGALPKDRPIRVLLTGSLYLAAPLAKALA